MVQARRPSERWDFGIYALCPLLDKTGDVQVALLMAESLPLG